MLTLIDHIASQAEANPIATFVLCSLLAVLIPLLLIAARIAVVEGLFRLAEKSKPEQSLEKMNDNPRTNR